MAADKNVTAALVAFGHQKTKNENKKKTLKSSS